MAAVVRRGGWLPCESEVAVEEVEDPVGEGDVEDRGGEGGEEERVGAVAVDRGWVWSSEVDRV